MNVNPAIFKAYDIRGVVPGEFDADVAERIGRVFARSGETYVVGRDMRATSPAIAKAVARGVMATGADVVDVGLVSTPTFYYAVRALGVDGGLMATASHNPSQYNGAKLVRRTAAGDILKVGRGSGMEEVRDAVLGAADAPAGQRGSMRTVEGITERETGEAVRQMPLTEVPKIRIVADSGNGMGATYLDALFARLGMAFERLYFELDGTFPNHPPDPLQHETLRDLQARVRATSADLGIATDGDGDRVFFVDERGGIVPASLTTALVARELLREHPGERVLVDVRYTRNATAAVRAAGGTVDRSRVGHALISEQLRRERGIFAGESSGHYFFRDAGYAEAPLLVILAVLRALAREQRSLSAMIEPLRVSHESGEVNFRLADPAAVAACLTALRERYADGETSELDGLSVDYPEWRFNVRGSNTEPLLRLNIEGTSAEIVAGQREEVAEVIRACIGQ